MVSDENSAESPQDDAPRREPLSPAKRKRLQRIFEHASKQMAQENFDYATELFEQCVLGDPTNLIYAQNFVGNLQRKYNNNKTGSKLAQLKERGARSAVKKAVGHGEWDEAIKNGLKVLTVNPWDVPTLTAMATATENLDGDEVELYYLKCALDVNSKDPAVNRQCAVALAARGQFDQAIACWHRVEQAKPDDEEARREISRLAVEKTIAVGGYEDKEEAKKLADKRIAQPQLAKSPEHELSAEEQLKRKVSQNPTDLASLQELAQMCVTKEDYKSAEEILAKAVEVSDNDPNVRERWEDVQLRHMRQQLNRAEDDASKKEIRERLIQREIEVYELRCERYPNNLGFRFDLGYRYQLDGKYNDAIKQYQQARNDPRRRGLTLLRLGQCFEKIKQNRLAMTHYESAIIEIPDRDEDDKKEALHRAARLAMATEDIDTAEKHLTTLAELDFAYKDVSAMLDKISELRKDQ